MGLFKKIRDGILPPPIPKAENFGAIIKYLITDTDRAVTYNNCVFGIGLFSFLFSIALLAYLISNYGIQIVIHSTKQYPSLIFSSITMAFSKLEIYEKRKSLYEKVQALLEKLPNDTQEEVSEDLSKLLENYQTLTWDHFKEIFNPTKQ